MTHPTRQVGEMLKEQWARPHLSSRFDRMRNSQTQRSRRAHLRGVQPLGPAEAGAPSSGEDGSEPAFSLAWRPSQGSNPGGGHQNYITEFWVLVKKSIMQCGDKNRKNPHIYL